MPKLKGAVLDMASLDRADLQRDSLQRLGVDWSFFENTTNEVLHSRLKGMDIVVSNKVCIDRVCIEKTEIKLICVAATGFNNVDVLAAQEHNVPVCNVRAYATASVVQHVFMLLLSLLRASIVYFTTRSR